MSTEQTFGEKDFQKRKGFGAFMKRIFKHTMRYDGWFYGLILSTLLAASAEAMLPVIWLNFIDKWITPNVEALGKGASSIFDIEGFWLYVGLFLLTYVFLVISIAIFIRMAGKLNEFVIYDLRNEMFSKLQYLSYSFYDKSAIGHLSIRVTADVKKVARVISWGFVDLIYGVFMIIVSLSIMFWYSWRLTLIVMGTIPVLLFLAIKVRGLLIGYARKARKTYSEMAAYLTEHINGLEVNKTTVQEERASSTFRQVSEKLRDAAFRSSFYSSMYNPIVVVTGSIAAALVIYLGGHLTVEAQIGITIGTLAAFFSYARMIFEPIFDITNYYAIAQDSLSAGERIFTLIDEPLAIKDKEGVLPYHPLKGDIEFKSVDFFYNEANPILNDFNLHIPAGQSVAIVGSTGSGKSTLVKLVCRFYEPRKGELLIDGVDYRERKLDSFRSQLGIILQTPHLFAGTFRENLRYGKLDATDQEIQQALHLIGASEFASRLDEEVGEEGNNLSAGEKQMIAFARAILRNPQILIMDEATSSVDTLAEQRIQKGIDTLIEGRTAIIIAHRLSTIRNCDRILVMQQGKILEDGSHDELIKQGGHYYQLYTYQAREVHV